MSELTDVVGKGEPQAPSLTNTVTGGEKTAGTTGSDQTGSGTGEIKLAAWADQLPKELRETGAAHFKDFQSMGDLAKSYIDLKAKAENAVPGKEAKAEEVSAFWEKLGTPKDKGGYTIAKEKGSEGFAQAAHAARLTDEQASAVWKHAQEETNRQVNAYLEAQNKDLAETDAALRKEYGDKYEAKIELFKRGIGNSGILEVLKASGLAGKPEIVRAFIALGEATSESKSPQTSGEPKGGDYMSGNWYGTET